MTVVPETLAMPYPGLRPFEAEDQPLFFGREAQVSGMLRQLEDDRFVAVVGSSGSGKSSLVRAGLLPAVREGFLLGTNDWLTIVIKPGHQPYQRLVRALFAATSGVKDAQVVSADETALTSAEAAILATLRRTDRGLLNVLGELSVSSASRVMVVVDQFEELFAFRRAGANRNTVASRDEAAAFVGMLIRSAAEPAGSIWIILTMRSDFTGDCEAFLGLPEQISRSQFLVPRLDRGQMEEAIARPGRVAEGAFKTFGFEEGLVNRIINDAGDRPDQLPLMQHALMRTWKRAAARANAADEVLVTAKDYEAAGGIEMALSLDADTAWDEIKDDPKKAAIARHLFLLLCDISPDGQITRRRPRVAEVQSVTGASPAEIEEVVRVFQRDDRNFLLPPRPQHLTAETYLDISHEALLRQWRLFAGEWQAREQRDASELRRLAELASLRKQGQGVGLLPAQDLERIARWKDRVSFEWAQRYTTHEGWEEALGFVRESQLAAEKEREQERLEAERQRNEEERQKQAQQKSRRLWTAAIILFTAASFSVWQMIEARRASHLAEQARDSAQRAKQTAEQATDSAQDALAQPFSQFVGSSRESELPTPVERELLWELFGLDSTNANVRDKVIDGWFKGDESSVRALRRQAQGLHAAIGFDKVRSEHAQKKAKACADAILENKLKPEIDIDRLSLVGNALAGLATQMEPEEAASVAGSGADILQKRLTSSPGINLDQMCKLAVPIAALVSSMERKRGANVATACADALAGALEENGQEVAPERLQSAATALIALAAPMAPDDASGVAYRLAEKLENLREASAVRRACFGSALEAFAARIEPPEAASKVATRGVSALLATLQDSRETDSVGLWALGIAIAPLAARMEHEDARSVCKHLVDTLVGPNETSDDRPWALSHVLEAAAGRLQPSEAILVSANLAKALENSQEASFVRLWSLSPALVTIAGRLDSAGAKSVADGLLQALKNPRETSADRLAALSQALAAVARKLQPEDAESIGAALAREILTLQPNDDDRLASMASALEVLAARMEAGMATAVANVIVGAINRQQVIDPKRTLYLADALAALVAPLDDVTATRIVASGAKTVVAALDKSEQMESAKVSLLGWALGRLSLRIPSARKTRLLALSDMLLDPMADPGKATEAEARRRTQLVDFYALLETQDLVEVLKWPFCVGGAQKLALAALEKKTGRKFQDNIWEFVRQESSLGIGDLKNPARRPTVEEALKEITLAGK